MIGSQEEKPEPIISWFLRKLLDGVDGGKRAAEGGEPICIALKGLQDVGYGGMSKGLPVGGVLSQCVPLQHRI